MTNATCPECGPVEGWDEDGCCLMCGHDVPEAQGPPLCADCLARGREVPADYWRGGVHPQCANCNAGNEDATTT